MNLFAIILIFGSLLLLLLFLFLPRFRLGYYSNEIKIAKKQQPFILPQTLEVPKTTNVLQNLEIDNNKKGYIFEKFIVSKFDTEYFTVVEWRGDKKNDGVYPLSGRNPDLEIIFSSNSSKDVKFAIECKWRRYYVENGIQWASDYQLSNYRKFQKKRNIHVYVIIGVCGNPETPTDVYIIPLDCIRSTFLSRDQMEKFKRDIPEKNFSLYPNSMRLT